ncbi:zinc dependent phospholipase C family protein [Enorma phocaeensis]|uniref:Zinc dependent phospholipase C family protein n=1 Tax=Enorma phocaeensis TaxID=1871019 RepID=A0ABT7V838_9ACTN|nr:zinc dependent phospholipase C family protein [Enorma phocaeensis]MDM8274651.1 zinc dependent phospholipase C family protein [Enorma phocaeensis]
MPALITHRLFGEESIGRLPEGIVTSEDERIAFLIANQGPDPFFFRVRTPHMGECMEFGRCMHRCRMSRQFAALRDGAGHLNRHDAGVGRAFVLGLLSHYVLDRNAHPFVYAQQWGIQAADPDLADAGSVVHAVIEADLDVLMLQRKRDGATVASYPPESVLTTNERVNKVAGALTSYVAHSVYGLEVGANEYGGAVADMKVVYKLIEPAGSPASSLISLAEGVLHDWSLLGSLAHRSTTTPPAGAGNLAHRPWSDPFTHAESCESFPEVFDRALADYARAAACFVEAGDMAQVTRHVNYSGRPLDGDEEFDREE